MEAKKKYFMDCHLAGRQYHDADEVWDKLKVGTVLQLVLDTNNRHDPNAVAVVYNDKEQDDQFDDEDQETRAALIETRTAFSGKRTGKTGDDTNHNDQGDTITNTLVGDLLAEPHDEQGTGDEEDDR